MLLQKSSMSVGVVAAIASSLCCVTPLIAILAGSSSLAANFQWVEPLRPWLVGATVAALGLAWYLHLRPAAQDDCGCDIDMPRFWNRRPFLAGITVISTLMLTFPLYADALYPQQQTDAGIIMAADTVYQVEFGVVGMTCNGCEAHVVHAVSELNGIVQVQASYKDSNAIVRFDPAQTTISDIKQAIESTSYQVTEVKSNSSPKIN